MKKIIKLKESQLKSLLRNKINESIDNPTTREIEILQLIGMGENGEGGIDDENLNMEAYGIINDFEQNGLVTRDNGRINITEKGKQVLNAPVVENTSAVSKENIYWKDVTPNMKVVDKGNYYVADNKVVHWGSTDAREAQKHLKDLTKQNVHVPKFSLEEKKETEVRYQNKPNITVAQMKWERASQKQKEEFLKRFGYSEKYHDFAFKDLTSTLKNAVGAKLRLSPLQEDKEDETTPQGFLKGDPNFKGASFGVAQEPPVIEKKSIEFTEEEITLLENILLTVEGDDQKEEDLLFSIKNKLRP